MRVSPHTMKYCARAVAGLFTAFLSKTLLTSGFYHAVGQQMLDDAGWKIGTVPPTNYMVVTVVAALVASFLAGIAAAFIVGRDYIRNALAYAVIISGLLVWGNQGTLFSHPHPYEWPLALVPLIGIPLGAMLVATRLTPGKS